MRKCRRLSKEMLQNTELWLYIIHVESKRIYSILDLRTEELIQRIN